MSIPNGYQMQNTMPVMNNPVVKPLLFNYVDGAQLAPQTDMSGLTNGMAAAGKSLAGGITQAAQNFKQGMMQKQMTPEQQMQAYLMSQQALGMLQPQGQQPQQGMSGFNGLMQQANNQNQ